MAFKTLFNIQQTPNGDIRTLRVSYSAPTGSTTPIPPGVYTVAVSTAAPTLRIEIIKEDAKSGIKVENLLDAEKVFIEKALSTLSCVEVDSSANGANTSAILSVQLNRHANLIAARTRRGAGNMIILNPNDINSIPPNFGSSYVFVQSDFVPVGSYIVMYKGEGHFDGPAYYAETDDGNYLYLIDNTIKTLGNWEDYVAVVKVV